jgi:hypothetical protein
MSVRCRLVSPNIKGESMKIIIFISFLFLSPFSFAKQIEPIKYGGYHYLDDIMQLYVDYIFLPKRCLTYKCASLTINIPVKNESFFEQHKLLQLED